MGANGYFSGNGRKRQGSATGNTGNGGKTIPVYDSEKHIDELVKAKSAKASQRRQKGLGNAVRKFCALRTSADAGVAA